MGGVHSPEALRQINIARFNNTGQTKLFVVGSRARMEWFFLTGDSRVCHSDNKENTMYIYALANDDLTRDVIGIVLQHEEKKSLSELWNRFSQETERDSGGYSKEFSEWLVEEHGFVLAHPVVFNTDSRAEFELCKTNGKRPE